MLSNFRFKGKRELGSTVLFDLNYFIITYPTPTTWEADLAILQQDTYEYNYRFLNRDGTYSQYYTLSIPREDTIPEEHSAFNNLDEWGQRLDTPRLPNEDNISYRDRLLDVFVHKGSADYGGLVNAIARDLSLNYKDQALIVQTEENPDTGSRFEGVYLGSSSVYISVFSPRLVVEREKKFVHPSTLKVVPSYTFYSDLIIETEEGKVITDYTFDEINNALFLKEEYKYVYLSYKYMYKVSKIGKTLSTLESELEALLTPEGYPILNVTVYSGYSSATAEKLSKLPITLIEETHSDAGGVTVSGLPIRWTDCKIEVVWDPEVQKQLENWTGSLWNTKIDSAYEALVKTSKQTWGTAVADDSVWGSKSFPLHGGQHIKTIYDPVLGYWENPVTAYRFDQWQAEDGIDPETGDPLIYKGLSRKDLQSGVGSGTDLKVKIKRVSVETDTAEEGVHMTTEALEDTIPEGDPVEGYLDLP